MINRVEDLLAQLKHSCSNIWRWSNRMRSAAF